MKHNLTVLTPKESSYATSCKVEYNVSGFRNCRTEVECNYPNIGLRPPEGSISDQLNQLEL
jgi:hypothetical protein